MNDGLEKAKVLIDALPYIESLMAIQLSLNMVAVPC